MGLRSPANGCCALPSTGKFSLTRVIFASYGGLDGHYTAVLEPCTAMPVSVNEAARLNQCSCLMRVKY
jgi:hypothetical protein